MSLNVEMAWSSMRAAPYARMMVAMKDCWEAKGCDLRDSRRDSTSAKRRAAERRRTARSTAKRVVAGEEEGFWREEIMEIAATGSNCLRRRDLAEDGEMVEEIVERLDFVRWVSGKRLREVEEITIFGGRRCCDLSGGLGFYSIAKTCL